jgi:GGDEF domain-containing protein
MSAQELTIWSMALGAIAAVALGRLAEYALRPSISQLQGVGYHLAVFLLVFILSGVAAHTAAPLEPRLLHALQVLAGPVCVGLSDLWIRGWLYAPRRDRTMAAVLQVSGLLLPVAGVACLGLSLPLQLPVAAGISLLGAVVTFWLTARAAMRGDALAPVMAMGCLLTLPALWGLYGIAMELTGGGLALHALFALCAALSNGFTGFGLWRRDRLELRARRGSDGMSQLDPVTQLPSGRSLVHNLVRAQRRRRRSGQDGVVLAIHVFNVEKMRAEAGTTAVNQVFVCMANRVQRQLGTVNVVGRYYEACFVALVESIPSRSSLRTLGLRLSESVRWPVEVTTRSGDAAELQVDAGIGLVHLSRRVAAVEDILADAERMAQAAHTMPSRTAIRDPLSGQPVALEHACLDRRPRRNAHLLHAAS